MSPLRYPMILSITLQARRYTEYVWTSRAGAGQRRGRQPQPGSTTEVFAGGSRFSEQVWGVSGERHQPSPFHFHPPGGRDNRSATSCRPVEGDQRSSTRQRRTQIQRREPVRPTTPGYSPDSVGSDRMDAVLRPKVSRVSSMKANPRRTSGRRVMRRSPTREGGVSIWPT